jgi:hypothetical protein
LRFSHLAGHQARPQAQGFDGAGFVGDLRAGFAPAPAAAGPGGTSAASAPPTCRRATPWPARARGHRACLSVSASGSASRPPTASSRQASIRRSTQAGAAGSARRRAPAPSRGRRARFAQACRPCRHGGGARGAAAAATQHAVARSRHQRSKSVVVGRQHHQRGRRRGTARRPAACGHQRPPGQRAYCLGTAVPARCPRRHRAPGQSSAGVVGIAAGSGCVIGDSRIHGVTPRCKPPGLFVFVRPFDATPSIAPGKRFTLPRPTGSADALLLARLAAQPAAPARAGHRHRRARRHAAAGRRTALLRPRLRVALFPDWETLPYDTFSPHQDLISERLATLWRIHKRRRRRGAAAGHHRADAAGAAVVPGRHHLPLQAEDAAGRSPR